VTSREPAEVAGVNRRFRRPGPDRDRAVDDTCEQLEQLILQQAIGQMDALLRD
jgi:hypothetical protein